MGKLTLNYTKMLNDVELSKTLKQHSLKIGPIVDSTRSLYQTLLFKKQNLHNNTNCSIKNNKKQQICLNESSNIMSERFFKWQIFYFVV